MQEKAQNTQYCCHLFVRGRLSVGVSAVSWFLFRNTHTMENYVMVNYNPGVSTLVLPTHSRRPLLLFTVCVRPCPCCHIYNPGLLWCRGCCLCLNIVLQKGRAIQKVLTLKQHSVNSVLVVPKCHNNNCYCTILTSAHRARADPSGAKRKDLCELWVCSRLRTH